ncbi:hypothetical protein CRUP_004645 [Coryphaenoides rupestris]|nr:hypothetical protein CRUP_004645 [Coryphaenoides rupestris]
MQPGWYYFGRKKDTADLEWVMWFSTFREHILFALSGHVLFAKICSMLAPQLRWLCFASGLCTLATFKCEPFVTWQAGFVEEDFNLRHILFYGGCGFTVMRCVSFALENCERREGSYSFLDLLQYNFYLPHFYFGPIMTFDKFHVQVNRSVESRKEGEMWNIGLHGLLHLGGILLVDVLFHFLYILSIPTDMKLLKHLSDWAVVGLAYTNLVYDWVKAAIMFGVINTVSRLDHLDPPKPPKCITTLYVFAETYVYDHLGGNHVDALKELVATLCTFGVTILWLGPCPVVLLWASLNCLGLNLELWTAKLFSTEPLASFEMAMSEAMSRRIRAIFNSFNFWTIVLYNIVALNSVDFAKVVAKRLLLKGFPFTTLAVMFVTYCLVQVIKERERRQALLDDPDPIPPPPAPATPTPPTPAPRTSATLSAVTGRPTPATQPIVVPTKKKAE